MTISDNYLPTRTVGNGSTTAFSFSFKIFDETDIDVFLIDTGASTNKEPQTITDDYTVTINTTTEGGTINFVTAPPSTKDVILERSVPNDQTTDIPDVGSLNESQLEDTYDTSTMQIQQLAEEINRTLKLSVEDNSLLSNFDTTLTSLVSGGTVIVNGSKTGFTTTTLATLSAVGYPASTGIVAATGANVFESRTLSALGKIVITEPKGLTGNPTFDVTQITSDLAATTSGLGASTIGVEDSAGRLVAADVEAALAELADINVQQISATRAAATASGSQTIAHTLGIAPKYISCVGFNPTGFQTSTNGDCATDGTTFAQVCQSDDDSGVGGQHIQKSFIGQLMTSSEANGQRVAISAVVASSVTLTWTKVGTPAAGTYEFEFTLGR